MKRQQSLRDFFNKKPKLEPVVSELASDARHQSQAQPLQLGESSDMNENDLLTTCRVFNVVYSLAQNCKPFSQIEDLIELHVENGLDMGKGLHTGETAVKMADFIAKEMKKELFTKITERNMKVCLVIDEAWTIACNPVVVLFVKVEDSVRSPTIFLELVELEKPDAETIYSSIMATLNNVGLTKSYLEKNLIGFCSDGASVMLGRKSGLSTRIAKEFPNIIIWHCLDHRLQLVLHDSIKEIKEVNHFKRFIDKLYTIFLCSCELSEISEELEMEMVDIGRVLGVKWAACSLRSALAVWHAYPALHHYFCSNEEYLGMAARLENISFITDLGLMIDILKEISILVDGLKTKNIDLIKAEKFVMTSIKVFEMFGKEKGAYEGQVDELITSDAFKNIKFVENPRFPGLPRERLLETIIKNLHKKLTDCEHLKASCSQFQDGNKLQFLHFLNPGAWNVKEILVPWREAEEQLLAFKDIFQYQIDTKDYRNFVINVLKNPRNYAIPESVQKAQNIVRTIAVSSADAEEAFSKMNLICSGMTDHLTVSNISNTVTISTIGLPLAEWDPIPTVEKWLRITHTDDARMASEDANHEAV